MRRREFIAALGGVSAWPLVARAQQSAMPRVGVVGGSSHEAGQRLVAPLRQGLSDAGYIEGKNVTIEYRWADSQYDRLPALTADLLARNVAVIAALGNVAARAAKAATTTTPVVFASGSDPVGIGLVASLNQPGSNMTGVSILNNDLESKRFELLTEVVPQATTIAFLVNPDSPTTTLKLQAIQSAARGLGRRLLVLHARGEREFDTAFATLDQERVAAMMIASDGVFSTASESLGQLSARHSVPVISAYRAFAVAGGLMSYGTSINEAYRQAGVYVGRVLKGERPANLPVIQATKVELVLNLKTAKALGLTIPLPLLGRADEVIE